MAFEYAIDGDDRICIDRHCPPTVKLLLRNVHKAPRLIGCILDRQMQSAVKDLLANV